MQNTTLRWPPPRPAGLTGAGDYAPPSIAFPQRVDVLPAPLPAGMTGEAPSIDFPSFVMPADAEERAALEQQWALSALAQESHRSGQTVGTPVVDPRGYGESVRRARERAKRSGTFRGQVGVYRETSDLNVPALSSRFARRGRGRSEVQLVDSSCMESLRT
jgi:hypothetical protein